MPKSKSPSILPPHPFEVSEKDWQLRTSKALSLAMECFASAEDWIAYFRDVLGNNGVLRRLFPTTELLDRFQATEEYASIQRMLGDLRLQAHRNPDVVLSESYKVVTLRIPKCLHDSLRSEAFARETSMNQLCISKLVQLVEQKLVPSG